MNILFFGDIYGRHGRRAVASFIAKFKAENHVDLCIANCENLTDGKSVTEKTITEMVNAGVEIFSSGNHLWDRKESLEYIKTEKRIAKPLNYPKAAFGFDHVLHEVNGVPIMLLTVCGQAFMTAVNSPFMALDEFLQAHQNEAKCIIVDFHAESTAEKKAFGYFFDGRVSAILGTHTHVQTADEEILPEGTAFITDVGMCGPHDSVIGVKKEIVFDRYMIGMPVKHETADSGVQVNAVYIEIDEHSGKAVKMERIREQGTGSREQGAELYTLRSSLFAHR